VILVRKVAADAHGPSCLHGSPPDVRISQLGPDAALLGAATVTLDAVGLDPTLVAIASTADARSA
jgi:hypothetical protein